MIGGCSPNWPKRLDRKLSHLDGKALVLTTVSFESEIDSDHRFLPEVFVIGNQSDDDYEKINLSAGDRIRVPLGFDTHCLVAIDIDHGDNYFYSVRGFIRGGSGMPRFEAPMLMSFQTRGNELQYIGNIKLILREKSSESEHRAGPVTPLIDQASITNATFDVRIIDEYERDIKEYHRIFPNIRGRTVVKKILPSWKRPAPDEFEPKKTHFFFW